MTNIEDSNHANVFTSDCSSLVASDGTTHYEHFPACTKRRNVETERPKRNGRNHRNHRNDRNETTETKQPKRNDRNETAETKRSKRNGRKYKLQEKWKILIKI